MAKVEQRHREESARLHGCEWNETDGHLAATAQALAHAEERMYTLTSYECSAELAEAYEWADRLAAHIYREADTVRAPRLARTGMYRGKCMECGARGEPQADKLEAMRGLEHEDGCAVQLLTDYRRHLRRLR